MRHHGRKSIDELPEAHPLRLLRSCYPTDELAREIYEGYLATYGKTDKLINAVKDVVKAKRESSITSLKSRFIYKCEPVSVREFIESPLYLDKKNEVYPKVLIELEEINSGKYSEVVLTGGIGSAKTTAALYTICYQVYLLSIMLDPHAEMGLDPASEILIVFQSLNAGLAKALDYARFKTMIDSSPYFKKHFPYDPDRTARLVFPNRIEVVPISGLETAAIGQNVIFGILDELNYMSITEKSKHSVDSGTYDQAIALYNSIARRRKSRYMSAGSMPGILCLVSSKRYPGQFTDLKEEECHREIARTGKSTIYVYDKRVWEVKPEGSFSGKTFQVFIGDESRKPRIMGDTDFVNPEDRHLVDNIPIEFREDFEKDITNSLREIAGKSTLARHPFILNTESITLCMDQKESIFSTDSVDFVSDQLLLYPDVFHKPELPRYAHIDLGITGDSAGLVIGTIIGFEKVVRSNQELGETLPKYYIDGILEVRPPKGGEILFWKIRNILYTLRDLGLNIRWVSLDTFQSKDSMQILKQKGFSTGTLSMDTSTLPYEVTKTALYDGRVSMPYHAKLRRELASLEKDAKRGKIDHPSTQNASKDVSDSLAGVIYGVTRRLEMWALHGISPMEIPQSVQKAITDENGRKSKMTDGEYGHAHVAVEHTGSGYVSR